MAKLMAFHFQVLKAKKLILNNAQQRRPFFLSRSGHFLRIYSHHLNNGKLFALSARVTSFKRDRPPGGPPLVTPQLNGGPARRAANYQRGAGGWHRRPSGSGFHAGRRGVAWASRLRCPGTNPALRMRRQPRTQAWAWQHAASLRSAAGDSSERCTS